MASISVSFDPSGKYYQKEGRFDLKIIFSAFYDKEGSVDEKESLINVAIEGVFMFSEPLKFTDLPTYFYQNSIAIIFPYIRAFVTSLTAIANVNPFILPTMNLMALEEPLRTHTKCID